MQTNAAALNSQVNSKKRNSSSLTDQLRLLPAPSGLRYSCFSDRTGCSTDLCGTDLSGRVYSDKRYSLSDT